MLVILVEVVVAADPLLGIMSRLTAFLQLVFVLSVSLDMFIASLLVVLDVIMVGTAVVFVIASVLIHGVIHGAFVTVVLVSSSPSSITQYSYATFAEP